MANLRIARDVIALRGDAFEICWARPFTPLEAANQRAGGSSGVMRIAGSDWPELATGHSCYVKRQQGYYCHPLWRAGLPTPTLRRELRALRIAEQAGVPAPEVLAYGEASQGRALLVLRAVEPAQSLDEALENANAEGEARTAVLRAVAESLAALHRARLRHGALYPKHLLLESYSRQLRCVLIDFEKARRLPTVTLAARDDLARLQRRAPLLSAEDYSLLVHAYRTARAQPQTQP